MKNTVCGPSASVENKPPHSHKMPIDPQDERCNTCRVHDGLHSPVFVCSRCQVTFYCSRHHQHQDFASHRLRCGRVQAARAQVEVQEVKIRSGRGESGIGPPIPADVFETHVGRFHEQWGTAGFLEAKGSYAQALAALNTPTSLSIALEEAYDSVRLSPQDQGFVLGGIPIILLLQGKLQESYDFIKSWPTAGMDAIYASDREPHAVQDADLFEPIEGSARNKSAIVRSLLTFIKVELASQIQDVIHAHTLVGKKPLPSNIDSDVAQFLSRPLSGHSLDELQELHKRVMEQAVETFALTAVGVWRRILKGESQSAGSRRRSDATIYGLQEWFSPLVQLWRHHAAFLRSQLSYGF